MSSSKTAAITFGAALTLFGNVALGGFYNSNSSEENMRTATGYSGNGIVAWGLYEIFDVNDDGYDDLIYGVAINDEKTNRHSPTDFVKPVIFFWDLDSNSYKIDKSVQDKLPEMHWPRRAIGSKNPLTNEVELFIADHGLDGGHAQNCGAPNKLIRFRDGHHEQPRVLRRKAEAGSHRGDRIVIFADGIVSPAGQPLPPKKRHQGAAFQPFVSRRADGDLDKGRHQID